MNPEFDFKKAEKEDEENVEETGDDDGGVRSAVYKISSYGVDYDVNGLVRRLDNFSFFVPNFQRQYVWNQKQASRFIESLLLGLPVPGIFIYKEKETENHQIIDGQQRVESLRRFFSGFFAPKDAAKTEPFHLIDVDKRWEGLTVKDLSGPDIKKLDNAVIHTTVFHQDDPEDADSIYLVFERLNTGGSKLSAQEIRHCVNYNTAFTSLIEELNQLEAWREIYRQKTSVRMKDREMILRFFALYAKWGKYKRPMQGFLNNFMKEHRSLSNEKADEFRALFTNTIQFCFNELGKGAFRPNGPINVSVFDGVMVGTATAIVASGGRGIANYSELYGELLADTDFKKAYTGPTTDEANVQDRIGLAIEKFRA